ncbi:MAG: hypothetical protein AB1432_16290 [Bacteroidota bacterium]
MKVVKSFLAVNSVLRLFTSAITKLILIILILLIFVNINSCNGVTEPEIQPGRRDYVWEVDTINPGNESLYLLRLWGSSPSNVWAVGASSWSATSIWRFNGSIWKCDSIPRKVNPSGLFGRSYNEVWLGNTNSTIWKYDGNSWILFGEYKADGYDATIIQAFDGTANNIYGAGFKNSYQRNEQKSVLINFNGNIWRFINIPELSTNFETIALDEKSRHLVITGTNYDPKGFVSKVYCWDGKQLKELLSELGGWATCTKLGNDIFVSYSARIYKYDNKNLILWKNNTGTPINGNIICGRSGNDFFISANQGIAHYNGTNFEIIYKLEIGQRVQVLIGIVFEKELFFVAHHFDIGKNLIIRGKLQ